MTPEEAAAACLDTETAKEVESRMVPADIERPIASAIRAAVKQEREACAKVAEANTFGQGGATHAALAAVAAAIRARGK